MEINTENISLEFEINDRDAYSSLSEKPKINSVELNGNKSLSDLGITTEEEIDAKDTETLNTAKAYTDGITDGLDERVSENEEDIAALLADIETKADRSELPEKLSDLTNDTDFVSESVIDSKDTATLNTAKAYTDTEIGGLDIPTKTSDLTNDSGFITSAYHDSTKADATAVSAIDDRLTEAEEDIATLDVGFESLENTKADKTELDGKLDKVTASHAYSRVYAVNQSGEQTLINAVAKSTNAGTVPLTTTGGRIKTPEPINSDELTTKNYVDTHLSAKLDKPTTPTEKSVVTVDTNGTSGTVAESDFVKQTQIANDNTLGIVRGWSDGGISVFTGTGANKGRVYINKATENEITLKTNAFKPIVPSTLDLATKVGVTTNTITLTDAEKQSASAWILPAFTEEDEGKVLGIANGALAWVDKN